jgi:hypothetical protein
MARPTGSGPVPTAALIISVLALVVALSGVGYAALVITGKDVKNSSLTGKDVKNSSLTSKDVKDASLTGADVQDESLTGADVAESSLGTVPNATAVGGATLGQLTLGTSAGTSGCTTTTDGTYLDCSTATIVLPRRQRLLLIGSADVGVGTSANSNAYATCRLEVDNAPTGQPSQVGWGGTGFTAGNAFPQFAAALNTVTTPLAAGPHRVDIACARSLGTTLAVIRSEVSVVAISGD